MERYFTVIYFTRSRQTGSLAHERAILSTLRCLLNLFDSQLNYWTPEHTNSYFPRLYEKAEGNTKANQKHKPVFAKWAYLSIRNISLSYTFPIKLIKPLGITNLSVFFSGENLFTFDHLQGIDAERVVTDNLGQRGFTYPYMRQFSFGINLSL